MDESHVFEGKTSTEAIEKGLKELHLNKDDVEIHILKEEGKNKTQIRNELDRIMMNNYKGFDMGSWDDELQGMVNKYTDKHNVEFRELNVVNITRKELEFISRFQDPQKENLLFVMLVISKSKHQKYKKNKKGEVICENNDYWINCDRGKLFKLSKFKYDRHKDCKSRMEQRGYLIYDLSQLNDVIELSKQCDNTSIKLLYVDSEFDNEGITFKITNENKDDVLNYYLQWKDPDKYIKCTECGVWVKKGKTKQPKYCKKCAKKIDNINRKYRK